MVANNPLTDEQIRAQLLTTLGRSDRLRAASLEQLDLLHRAKTVALTRELARVKAKHGPDSDQARRILRRLETQKQLGRELTSEIQRAAIPAPKLDKEQTVVHGRIVDPQGAGRPDLTVTAVRDNRVLGSVTTDKNGYYKLSVSRRTDTRDPGSDEQIDYRIQIADASETVLMTDPDDSRASLGRGDYREIVLRR